MLLLYFKLIIISYVKPRVELRAVQQLPKMMPRAEFVRV